MRAKAKAVVILFALTVVLVPFGIGTNAGQHRPPRKRVAPNERHLEMNKHGQIKREFRSGEEIPAECVEIQCPDKVKNEGRGKSVKCWRCGKD